MTITILGIISLSILLGYVAYTTKNVRKAAYLELLDKKIQIYTACAGSDNEEVSIPSLVEIHSLEHNVFKDGNGKTLNSEDYKHFIVQGESMQFCGIHNNDIIFVDSKFEINGNTKFPVILVLRKLHSEEKSQYKIRRTWMRCKYTSEDNLIAMVKEEILPSFAFQEIRQLGTYDGDDALIQDLQENRIKIYEDKYINCDSPNENDKEIIISTTFHTSERKIRFSIHPVSIIEGEVIASFDIK